MKTICEKCEHGRVCKYKANYEALSKAAADLLGKEEAKDGVFAIQTECCCYMTNEPYLK